MFILYLGHLSRYRNICLSSFFGCSKPHVPAVIMAVQLLFHRENWLCKGAQEGINHLMKMSILIKKTRLTVSFVQTFAFHLLMATINK